MALLNQQNDTKRGGCRALFLPDNPIDAAINHFVKEKLPRALEKVEKSWPIWGSVSFGCWNFFCWYVHTETYKVSKYYKVGILNALGWMHLPLAIGSWLLYMYLVSKPTPKKEQAEDNTK